MWELVIGMSMRTPTTKKEELRIPTDPTRELVGMTNGGGLVRAPLGALPRMGAAHLEDLGVLQALPTTLPQGTLPAGLLTEEADGEAGAPPAADLQAVEAAAEVEEEAEVEVGILTVGSHLLSMMTTDQVTTANLTNVLTTKP